MVRLDFGFAKLNSVQPIFTIINPQI